VDAHICVHDKFSGECKTNHVYTLHNFIVSINHTFKWGTKHKGNRNKVLSEITNNY